MSGLELQLHEQARREEHEYCKAGLEALMKAHNHAVVLSAEWQESGPWYLVVLWELAGEDLDQTDEYAIWKNTGNVYCVHHGAVEDDPIIDFCR